MARELKELRQFEKGMYGQADGTDIPDDAAAICINTEPEAPYGTIRGIAKNSTVFSSLSNYTNFAVMKVLKERTGSNHIAGVDFSNNKVGIITNYDNPGTRQYVNQGSINHSNIATIETVNNQAIIGLGSGANNVPKWIGKVNKGQFGDTPSTNYIIEDADIKGPRVIKVTFTAATNIYGLGGVPVSTITLSDTSSLPSKGVLLVPVGTLSNYDYIGLTYQKASSPSNTLDITWPDDIETKYPSSGSPTIGGTNETAYYLEVGPGVVASAGTSMSGVYNPTKTSTQNGSKYDTNASVPNNSDADNFEEQTFYSIGVSYIYDGYKESPITRIPAGHYWFGFGNNVSSWEEITFKFFIQGFTDGITNNTASERITSIKFYMNITGSENDEVGSNQINSFRLIEELAITSSINSTKTLTAYSSTIGEQYDITAGAYEGDLYTDESGLSEYQSSSTLHYGVSCQHNSQLFVSDVYNPSAPDENWNNYIVRSIEFSYDLFNWTDDYLVLPNPITAIASHSGRVYAFDEFNMYRINPDQLYIEDTFNGLGCLSQQSIQSTERGLFMANDNGIYLYDGRQVNHISIPVDFIDSVDGTVDGVVNVDTFGYKACVKNNASFKPLLSYDADKECLIVYGEYTSGTRRIWLYRLNTGAWFVQGSVNLFDSVENIQAITTSATNSILAAYSNGIYEMFRDTNRKMYSWISKKINMGTVTQNKKFRKVYLAGNDISNVNAVFSIDGSSYANVSSLDSSSSSSNGKWIQIKASSTNTHRNTEVDHIGIVYRNRVLPK